MKLRIKSAAAGAAALALAGAGIAATATSASAYTGNPPWVGTANDTAAVKGNLNFFDASGNPVFSGSDYNHLPAFIAGSTAKTVNATKAQLIMAFPQSTNGIPATWGQVSLQGSTTFSPNPAAWSTPASINQANPYLKLALGASPTPVDDAFSNNATPDTATGYNNTFELRMVDSGAGATPDGKYWRAVIEFNPTASTFDGLAPGAWQEVFPVDSRTATTVSTPVATPASPVASGTSITLSSTEAAGSAHPAGSIQFFDGATAVGSAIVVNASGVATSTSFVPADGAHSYTAQFTPTDVLTYSPGTSTALSFTVTAPAHSTSTTLGAFTGLDATGTVSQPANFGGSVVVTDTTASVAVTTGTVTIRDNGTPIGTATYVPAASAWTFSISSSLLTVGTHSSITAAYTDGSSFTGSTSAAGTVIVAASTYADDKQYVQGTIPTGTLVISTPYTVGSPLDLGAFALNAASTLYTAAGTFQHIVVTDTRAGNLPWTAQASATSLTLNGTTQTDPNKIINGQNVGLTSLTLNSTNATPSTFGATGNIQPTDNPAAVGLQSGAAGTAGLGGSAHTVLHAGAGLGTTDVNGTLTITAPTNTLPGVYKGIVDFTILGS